MVKFTWIKDKVPKDLEVTQVYGIVFSNDFQIILQKEKNKYNLTGGKPLINENYDETLIREYLEEVNVLVSDINYLGYLLVEEDEKKYAQVRMIGKIEKVFDKRPDLDTKRVYDRFLSNIYNVEKYLNYSGNAGDLMLKDTILLAREKYEIKEINNEEFYI